MKRKDTLKLDRAQRRNLAQARNEFNNPNSLNVFWDEVQALEEERFAPPRHNFAGYARLTYRYNDGWKGEDEYTYVGLFRLLKWTEPDYGPDTGKSWYGESWARTYTVKAPAGLSFEQVENVLRNEFRHSCRCEHDCCGHTSSRAHKVIHVKRREYRVVVSFSINC